MQTGSKRLVAGYLEQVWNRGDIDGSAVWLGEDYRRHAAPGVRPLDVQGQQARLRRFRQAFPDARLEVHEMAAERDLVAFRFTLSGTHLGPFQEIEPTGRRVEVYGLDMVRVREGLLVEHWGGADLHELRAQLTR